MQATTNPKAETKVASANLYHVQLDKPLDEDPAYVWEDNTSLMVNVLNGAVQAEVCVDEDTLKKTEDRKSTRLNSSHVSESRMPSSA